MMANMACSLIEHKRINTTVAKAKALRQYIEPLVTKSKDDSTHSRRVVFSYLGQKEAVTELFREVSVKVGDRPGGYTRIIRTGNRLGDNADMCMIELVDFNETYTKDSTAKKKRSRRGKKSSGAAATAAAVATGAAATVAAKAADVVEDVKEAAADVVEDVKDAVVESVEEVSDVVEDVADEAADSASDVVSDEEE